MMTHVAEIDGFGRVAAAAGDLTAVPASRLTAAVPGPDAPPGLYAGETARVAFNVFAGDATAPTLAPAPPLSAIKELLNETQERPLAAWLLSFAVVLLMIDLLVALWLSGRRPKFAAMTGAVLLAFVITAPHQAQAQDLPRDIERALAAANDTILAYVVTGDRQVDRLSEAGLRGLSNVLAARTAIEPGEPMSVNVEIDDLTLFPMIYWPVTEGQAPPSAEAAARLNAYLRTGGMIIFDTRDAHLAAPGQPGPNTRALRRLAADLDLPPLGPVRADHVLTRTFYLLDRFPGRWTGGQVWLEATAPRGPDDDPALIADPNDGVSPVLIGAADWAASWAIDENGDLLVPVGRANGARQREMSFRFGVNAVMYALTGNYKSDQVHVPALLERLGN